MKKEIVILTCEMIDQMHNDEAPLPILIEQLGFSARHQVWNSWKPQANEMAVIKSTWDYHLRYSEFLSKLTEAKKAGATVWNPIETVAWNANKSYLLDLEKNGSSIIPTTLLRRGHEVRYPVEASNYVIKPVVSASAYNTQIIEAGEVQKIEQLLAVSDHGILVQPFLSEVQSEGEWSLIFIDNKYSHTVLKTPKKGDFRVQGEYGSFIRFETPPKQALEASELMIKKLDRELLYARVDGLMAKNKFLLMELELIEPNLQFLGDKKLMSNFAKSITHASLK